MNKKGYVIRDGLILNLYLQKVKRQDSENCMKEKEKERCKKLNRG
jgi:hypothetical protein